MLRGSVHGTFGFDFFLGPSPDEGGNQTPSEVIRGHEAIA
jgi:hypothetical protein